MRRGAMKPTYMALPTIGRQGRKWGVRQEEERKREHGEISWAWKASRSELKCNIIKALDMFFWTKFCLFFWCLFGEHIQAVILQAPRCTLGYLPCEHEQQLERYHMCILIGL